jgi:hypothetical protein
LNPIYFRPFVRAIVANDLLIKLRPLAKRALIFGFIADSRRPE